MFDAGAFQVAGAPSDQLVRDGGVEDGAKHPIGLRRGIGTGIFGDRRLPRPNAFGCDLAQLGVPEVRTNIPTEHRLIALSRRGRKRPPFDEAMIQPISRVLTEQSLRAMWVDDESSVLIAANLVEVLLRVLVRTEGLSTALPVDHVANEDTLTRITRVGCHLLAHQGCPITLSPSLPCA